MITIVLDGRYLVMAGAILNLIGMLAVLMTDSGNVENNFLHYAMYLTLVVATGLAVIGIIILW